VIKTLRSVLRFRKVSLDRTARRLERAANTDDLRSIARKRLPAGVFDYIDGGAEDERTLRANADAFANLTFRPRVLRDVSSIDPSVVLLGRSLPLPLVCAPTGFTRIADPQGELAVARAAARAGLPYTLSTLATRSIEEVADASDGPKWFQVYVWRDRGLVKDMITRASSCGYEALMLTVDTAVLGRRERDVRRGFTLPPKIGLDTLLDGMRHPSWTWRFVRSEPVRFANVAQSLDRGREGRAVGDGSTAVSLADYMNQQFDPSLSWSDVEWMRSVWDGPIVIKGIQTIEDALIAAGLGIEAISLSNHGGRQLDTAPVPLDLVAPVVDAVRASGSSMLVLLDGGVRRGSDVVKAVALGASAALIGRAYLYGLGAAGERGVDHVFRSFDADVRRTLALLGVASMGELSRDHLCLSL
jgi:L-lactate dehydrogenase (cytochrome)